MRQQGKPPILSLGFHYRLSADKLFTARELDEFVALHENPNTTEQQLHNFLKDNPKFLFALGAYEALVSEFSFPYRDRIDPHEGRLRLDFLLKDRHGYWDIVELKKGALGSDSEIVGRRQRRRFGSELQDGIAQVSTYLDELNKTEVQDYFETKGVKVQYPQAWLVVGSDSALDPLERRRLYKTLPSQLRIVTYDDLLSLAKQRPLIITPPSIIVPRLEQAPTPRPANVASAFDTAPEKLESSFRETQTSSSRSMRLQLELPESRLRELENLMAEAGFSTKKELINNALTLLQWATHEAKAGSTIAAVDEANHTYRELILPYLERTAKRDSSSAIEFIRSV